jgi:hypothetical protein
MSDLPVREIPKGKGRKESKRRPLEEATGLALLPEVQQQVVEADRKLREEEAKAKKRKRSQDAYDLPPAYLMRVREIAEIERTAKGDIVAFALLAFFADYDSGDVNLTPLKRWARSAKVEHRLNLPEYKSPGARKR